MSSSMPGADGQLGKGMTYSMDSGKFCSADKSRTDAVVDAEFEKAMQEVQYHKDVRPRIRRLVLRCPPSKSAGWFLK
eukprot:SAG11_NODE_5343_length_1589_cov_1.286577_2_plen_77_part_00